ncbi:TIGR03086 family protein [Streptomyces sp. AJS327]|uniref:TIGR03086 family metal-binding protein n=1 Tax=Streptomyces sp. AJS327 TaxID=2545265 RepID=UPI0015DDCBC0|nr:TIGR03086 family metal-binding protein [Streptomyces sp. AJS327]MBA0052868.1 TIGR03086 family protein [Streptomyces sp. AJS327]
MDLLEFDKTAVLETVRLASEHDLTDLTAPTPCADWTLGQLLSHMAGQHHGFAAAARGDGGEASVWEDRALGDDPLGAYRAAAETVLAAFAEPGVLEREFQIPEITRAITFPGRMAVGFHFLDYVVHGWDLARTLGTELKLPGELHGAVLAVAQQVPNDESRLGPNALFAPSLTPAPGADPLDQTLALVGRSPDWIPPRR